MGIKSILNKTLGRPLDRLLSNRVEGRTNPFRTRGSAGFSSYGGYVVSTEKNPALTGVQKYTTYANMLANTAIVSAGVRYFLNLVSRSTWTVVPADDTPEAREMAEFVEDIMRNTKTPWHRIIRRAAMYRFYGFSIQEWTAMRLDDGRIGLYDIAPRSQRTIERWVTDEQGDVLGVIQRSPQTQEELSIPRNKVVYMVDDTLNESPEGLGLFRHLVEPVQRLARYQQLEGFSFETDLRGIPVGRAPYEEIQRTLQANEGGTSPDMAGSSTSTEDQDRQTQQLRGNTSVIEGFIQKHIKNPQLGLVLDSSTYRDESADGRISDVYKYDVELLTADATGQAELARAIQRTMEEIARVMGVENLLLGSGTGGGSLAMAQTKTDNFFLIVDSTLQELRQTFERDIIDRIWELNGFNDDLKPTFETEEIQFISPEQVTQAIRDLSDSGAPLSPDDPAINKIRSMVGVPPIDLDRMLEDAMIARDEETDGPDEPLVDVDNMNPALRRSTDGNG